MSKRVGHALTYLNGWRLAPDIRHTHSQIRMRSDLRPHCADW